MFKLFSGITLIPLIVLFALNPSLDDGVVEVNRRIKEQQSTARASWNGVTRITGVDWLGKQAGLGTVQLCRKNLYVASLYSVREVNGSDPEDQIAVGLGIGGKIWGEKLMDNGDTAQKVLSGVARPLASKVEFSECTVIKKSGKLL